MYIIKEIRSVEDLLECMPYRITADATEDERRRINALAREGIQEFKEKSEEREIKKTTEEIEIYSRLGRIYLKSEKERTMGYEFMAKARSALDRISGKIPTEEAKRLESLIKTDENKILQYKTR